MAQGKYGVLDVAQVFPFLDCHFLHAQHDNVGTRPKKAVTALVGDFRLLVLRLSDEEVSYMGMLQQNLVHSMFVPNSDHEPPVLFNCGNKVW